MIKRLRQSPKLIMRRRHRQGCPKSLSVRDAFGHQRSMPGQLLDRRKASPDVQCRYSGGQQETQREKQQGHPSKAVEHSVGPEGRDGYGKNERLISSLKRNERHAQGFSVLQGSYPEIRLRTG